MGTDTGHQHDSESIHSIYQPLNYHSQQKEKEKIVVTSELSLSADDISKDNEWEAPLKNSETCTTFSEEKVHFQHPMLDRSKSDGMLSSSGARETSQTNSTSRTSDPTICLVRADYVYPQSSLSAPTGYTTTQTYCEGCIADDDCHTDRHFNFCEDDELPLSPTMAADNLSVFSRSEATSGYQPNTWNTAGSHCISGITYTVDASTNENFYTYSDSESEDLSIHTKTSHSSVSLQVAVVHDEQTGTNVQACGNPSLVSPPRSPDSDLLLKPFTDMCNTPVNPSREPCYITLPSDCITERRTPPILSTECTKEATRMAMHAHTKKISFSATSAYHHNEKGESFVLDFEESVDAMYLTSSHPREPVTVVHSIWEMI